ncbi:hypothetical protein NC652_017278 [Populus alba x Populus x berolinensis]|nr:hypothetical protein NC652_017278 [Populus alba x Populus x berolinensis]
MELNRFLEPHGLFSPLDPGKFMEHVPGMPFFLAGPGMEPCEIMSLVSRWFFQWRCGQDSFSCSKECCRVCYLVLFLYLVVVSYFSVALFFSFSFSWTGERGGDI